MKIHFILLYVIFVLTLIYRKKRDNSDKKNNSINVLLILIFSILALFIGMRNITVGTDTATYVSLFWNHNYTFSNLEIIPQLISMIVGFFTDEYSVFLTILSAICLFGIYKNAKNYKFDTEYFLFLYMTSFCYLYSTSAVRFFCAFSIIMFSFKYMINKETKKVILLILIAMLFHTSALIFLPAYFLTKFNFTKNKLLIFILIASLFVLVEKVISIEFIFQIDIFSKYGYIIENQNDVGGISVIMNICILILSLLYYNNIKQYKTEYEFFIKMHVFAMMLDFIGYAYRVIWYFRFPIWFILPIILLNIKKTKKKDYIILYVIFLVIYSVIYYYYISVSLDTHNFLNYTFNNL